jgi:excisionase family DNA binding protein
MDLQTKQSIESTIESPNLQLLTAIEVAKLLRVSSVKVYQMMQRGEIPIVHFGRTKLVRQQDLEEFIKAHLEGKGG